MACQKRKIEDVKLFLPHDTKVLNQVGKSSGGYEWTGLGAAARWGCGHTEIAKLLLDNGADPNKKSKDGLTPLRYAYNDEIKQLLIAKGGKGEDY